MHIFRRHGYSMSCIAVYFRFIRVILLCSKNYEYFCGAQNYELEIRLHQNISANNLREGVRSIVGIGKIGKLLRLKILNASQKSKIQFPRLSFNCHKSTRISTHACPNHFDNQVICLNKKRNRKFAIESIAFGIANRPLTDIRY